MAAEPKRDEPGEVTRLLRVAVRDNPQAMGRLIDLVHDELLRRARQQLAQLPPWRTLDPSGLVGEFFLKLFGPDHRPDFESRNHFYSVASKAMRWILIDRARRARRKGLGQDLSRVPLTDNVAASERSFGMLELAEALEELERRWPDRARIVDLRFFAGKDEDFIAEVMGISTATVGRRWRATKAWLLLRLGHGDEGFADSAGRAPNE